MRKESLARALAPMVAAGLLSAAACSAAPDSPGTSLVSQSSVPTSSLSVFPGLTEPQAAAVCRPFGSNVNVSLNAPADQVVIGTSSLALDQAGLPMVAWVDGRSGSPQVYARHFDGAAWQAMGASVSGTGISNMQGVTTVTLGSGGGAACVAWTAAQSAGIGISARCFDGNGWVDLGGSGTFGGVSPQGPVAQLDSVALTLDASLDPYVFYSGTAQGSGWSVFHNKWSGTQWTAGAATTLQNADLHHARAAARGQTTYMVAEAWSTSGQKQDIYIFADAQGTLQPFAGGNVSNTKTVAADPTLAITSAGNPVVAWTEETPAGEAVRVAFYDGSAWQPLAGSCGYATCTRGSAQAPRLALTSKDVPVLVWQDDSPGYDVVYLAYWTGSDWAELSGSASGNGVSAVVNSTHATAPGLALDPTDAPVVSWLDSTDIYVCAYH